MNTTRTLTFAALVVSGALLALSACTPKPHITTQQVQGVMGLSMDEVRAKLGGPHVVTDAGDSVWWDYDDVAAADGKGSASCQVIFKKGVVDRIKC